MFASIKRARSMAKAVVASSSLVPSGNSRGAVSANRAVDLVVAVTVGALMAAFLLPIAVDEIESVDTSSWSDGASSIWGVLSILVVLSIFLYFVNVATDST